MAMDEDDKTDMTSNNHVKMAGIWILKGKGDGWDESS